MENFSILIIDDEESQLKSLNSFLTRRGYSVFTAASGPDGFEIARSNTLTLECPIGTDLQ
jgi:CheY-like chemotaxis protein